MTTTLLPGITSGILFACRAANAAAPEGSTTRPAWKNVFTALRQKQRLTQPVNQNILHHEKISYKYGNLN